MRLPQHTSHIKIYTYLGMSTKLTICARSKLVNGRMVYAAT